MKIIVFSDSHGNEENMMRVLMQNQMDTSLVLYAGDGIDDIQNVMFSFPKISFEIVGGNREEYLYSLFDYKQVQYESLIQLDNHKILLTHGHKYNVKSSEYTILKYAQSKGADIIVYGHTHIPVANIIDSTYILNPGSIGSSHPTYGLINIKNNTVEISINELN